MPDRLHWDTVAPHLKEILTMLTGHQLFQSFRLVGGTALSLQRGHRMSDDIDLFTDAPYGSIDFHAIDTLFRDTFKYVSALQPVPIGMGTSYLVGKSEKNTVKVDLYYTDTFIQPALKFGPYRLATVDEIIAMKMDVVQRLARKKDFWDIHELLDTYTPAQMIELHKQRYHYGHDKALIRKKFADFSRADQDFAPVCLRGKHWELIKLDIDQAIENN